MRRVADHQRKRRLPVDFAHTAGRAQLGEENLTTSIADLDPGGLGKGKFESVAGRRRARRGTSGRERSPAARGRSPIRAQRAPLRPPTTDCPRRPRRALAVLDQARQLRPPKICGDEESRPAGPARAAAGHKYGQIVPPLGTRPAACGRLAAVPADASSCGFCCSWAASRAAHQGIGVQMKQARIVAHEAADHRVAGQGLPVRLSSASTCRGPSLSDCAASPRLMFLASRASRSFADTDAEVSPQVVPARGESRLPGSAPAGQGGLRVVHSLLYSFEVAFQQFLSLG
jgi:hypothetical protein